MERETAYGLAGAGGLLAAVSLALPWYSVTVSEELTKDSPFGTPTLGHTSGWDALGSLHWVVLALAIVAGLKGAAQLAPGLPAIAAGTLLAIVAWRYLDPPSITDSLPAASNPLTGAVQAEFIDQFTKQIGLGYTASVGLFAAAGGAAAALYAALTQSS